jgi:hypothetical protein
MSTLLPLGAMHITSFAALPFRPARISASYSWLLDEKINGASRVSVRSLATNTMRTAPGHHDWFPGSISGSSEF